MNIFTEMFTKALDMMNRAVSGHFQPGVKENMAYFTLNERRNIGDTSQSRSSSPATSIPQTAPMEVMYCVPSCAILFEFYNLTVLNFTLY